MENILNSTLNILNKLTKDGSLIKFICSSVVYVYIHLLDSNTGGWELDGKGAVYSDSDWFE